MSRANAIRAEELARLNIQRAVPLEKRNTFGFPVNAEYFVTVSDDAELVSCLDFAETQGLPVFVLGGGSNLVLTKDIPGLVITLGHQSIHYTKEPSTGNTRVTAGAGVVWHELVMHTLDAGYNGLENLSLIPGTVGAAPIQNIGAYGVELVDRFHSLRAWHRPSREFKVLAAKDCAFSYRHSRFKREAQDWIVTSVSLNVGVDTPLVTDYGSLQHRLAETPPSELTARCVSDAVVALRQERLPDPSVLGNAGSFFHNPIIPAEQFTAIAREHPGVVSYAQEDGRVKLAAGWLIDKLGYRGQRRGAVGVHVDQALVLVHHGGGSGKELMQLVAEIQSEVLTAYGIRLQVEPLVH